MRISVPGIMAVATVAPLVGAHAVSADSSTEKRYGSFPSVSKPKYGHVTSSPYSPRALNEEPPYVGQDAVPVTVAPSAITDSPGILHQDEVPSVPTDVPAAPLIGTPVAGVISQVDPDGIQVEPDHQKKGAKTSVRLEMDDWKKVEVNSPTGGYLDCMEMAGVTGSSSRVVYKDAAVRLKSFKINGPNNLSVIVAAQPNNVTRFRRGEEEEPYFHFTIKCGTDVKPGQTIGEGFNLHRIKFEVLVNGQTENPKTSKFFSQPLTKVGQHVAPLPVGIAGTIPPRSAVSQNPPVFPGQPAVAAVSPIPTPSARRVRKHYSQE